MSIHQICGVEPISTLPTLFRADDGPFVWTLEDFHLGNIISSSQRYTELKNSTALEWILQDAVSECVRV